MTDPCSSHVPSCHHGDVNNRTATAHVSYRHAASSTIECDVLYEIFLVGIPEEGEETLAGSEAVGQGPEASPGDEAMPLPEGP